MSKPRLVAVAAALAMLSVSTLTSAAPAPVNVSGPRAPDNNDPFAAVSGDGRYVAYDAQSGPDCQQSITAPVDGPSESDCVIQVYVYDRVTKKTELVSRTPGGAPGNAASRRPTISANGRWVAFLSAATNLLPGKPTDVPLYVHDRAMRTNARVRLPGGTRTDEARFYAPRISPDGNVLVIDPNADLETGKLVYVERGPLYALWWRTGKMVPITVGSTGQLGSSSSYDYGISHTGRYVAFSTAHPLSPADTDTRPDVYVRDTTTGKTVAATATIPETCDPLDTVSGSCAVDYREERLDATGRMLAFTARRVSQGTPGTSPSRVGVRDLVTGAVRFKAMDEIALDLYTTSVPYPSDVWLSGDGKHVFFVLANEVSTDGYSKSLWHWDLGSDAVTRLAGGSISGSSASNQQYAVASSSTDGRVLAFLTTARLAPDDTDAVDDVYVLAP